MLIGKKCEFNNGSNIYTGIIVDKFFRDNDTYYIVDTGEKIKHLPCLYLTKIYYEISTIKTKIENDIT